MEEFLSYLADELIKNKHGKTIYFNGTPTDEYICFLYLCFLASKGKNSAIFCNIWVLNLLDKIEKKYSLIKIKKRKYNVIEFENGSEIMLINSEKQLRGINIECCLFYYGFYDSIVSSIICKEIIVLG